MDRGKPAPASSIIKVAHAHQRVGCSESKRLFHTLFHLLSWTFWTIPTTFPTNDYRPLSALCTSSTTTQQKIFAAIDPRLYGQYINVRSIPKHLKIKLSFEFCATKRNPNDTTNEKPAKTTFYIQLIHTFSNDHTDSAYVNDFWSFDSNPYYVLLDVWFQLQSRQLPA